MAFEIRFTLEALEDLRSFRKRERSQIVDEIESQLTHQPSEETRNRKRLRPNQLAEWELRIDKYRVFYDVELNENQIRIAAVGRKRGSKLIIRGEEYQL